MKRCSLLLGSIAFVSTVWPLSAALAERCCYRADGTRGVAIMSPLESPDPCPFPVGGEYRYTPYYRGYAIDRRCPVPIYGAVSTHGVPAPAWSSPGPGRRAVPYLRGNYGMFSGASQDENYLLHLGGFGPGAGSSPPPRNGTAGDEGGR